MKSAIWTMAVVWLAKTTAMFAMMTYNLDKNISDVAIALAEIIRGLNPTQLSILTTPRRSQCNSNNDDNTDYDTDQIQSQRDVDDFIYRLHKLYFKSVIYYDIELFFELIQANLMGSIESVNLVFCPPYELSKRIHDRRLSHRLSLFIFYWGAAHPPRSHEVHFKEPMRVVVITRPRLKAFRIYYNQAVPSGSGQLKLVNWFDADNLGLQNLPLLPNAANVYSNFQGRVFRVPVFHSPPWFWVNYENDTTVNNASSHATEHEDRFALGEYEEQEVNVTGGRDHRLLSVLAEQMNFNFIYIDAPGRTQGSLSIETDLNGIGNINLNVNANDTFTGGIGLLQNGMADFLLGDIGLSWERRKAIEFSFFTLADSGAFATHAPRRLNEALAIVRPFKRDVWPYLILTVLFSGPIFYTIIVIPYMWRLKRSILVKKFNYGYIKLVHNTDEERGEFPFYMAYIREITSRTEATQQMLLGRQQLNLARRDSFDTLPPNLMDRCIWFTVQLFLKQSCRGVYHGYRLKFLMIVYWIAATYVLADVYSAQLTSQFARPAHEAPINTLQRLKDVMHEKGYQLYVEKESSSLEMLENGTEVFRQLYALMKLQNPKEDGYLIDSVEAGIQLIADGLENKAVLAGRETLYFNIQQYGSKSFQLSQKLYTRYSAVAVQIGCPFLDSVNDVLMRLFEGGILDKITNAEYSEQSRRIGKGIKERQGIARSQAKSASNDLSNDQANNKKEQQAGTVYGAQDAQVIQPLNVRMLQGAFIALLVGNAIASAIFLLEVLWRHLHWQFTFVRSVNGYLGRVLRRAAALFRRTALRILR